MYIEISLTLCNMSSHFSDISNDLQTIREFTANMVIEAASKCLHLINEDINLPTSLPESMSTRFRIGASLAAACQVNIMPIFKIPHFALLGIHLTLSEKYLKNFRSFNLIFVRLM